MKSNGKRKGKAGQDECLAIDAGIRVQGGSEHGCARAGYVAIGGGAGNDGIRHLGWHPRGHCRNSHSSVSSQDTRALDGDCRWHQRSLAALGGCKGQSTVEYALIMGAFLALVISLAALWHLFGEGTPVQHALAAASHHVSGVPIPFLADIFRY